MKIHPTLIDVYETENSTYEVDIRQALYRRTAKGRDVEWHPLKTFSVVDDPYGSGKKVLHIILRIDSTVGIFTSPLL